MVPWCLAATEISFLLLSGSGNDRSGLSGVSRRKCVERPQGRPETGASVVGGAPRLDQLLVDKPRLIQRLLQIADLCRLGGDQRLVFCQAAT